MLRVGRLGNLVHVVSVLVGQCGVRLRIHTEDGGSSGVLCPVCPMLYFKRGGCQRTPACLVCPRACCLFLCAYFDHIAMFAASSTTVTNT